ncbi:PREDICTED: uncharacterized protein LOC104742571 [Camelina sativa]|uniref:Uncharacterized protein LOC104742571 n=1 Tax=Camelina sativa TaxID=90675 RepID=A0ABM0VW06_CAMSA|nr:PREDICTED: uncharacterized protein LOC104742571 [Camelina sativa]
METMTPVKNPYWDGVHAKGDTGVFWDVVDFPIPAECDPALVSKLIKSALDEQGCCNGSVSIRLYDVEDEKTTKQEVKDKYEAAEISISFVPEVAEAHGHARVHKMLLDILLWALSSVENSNLIILSKKLKGDSKTVGVLEGLHFDGRKILLSECASKVLSSTETSEWLLIRLCESLPSQASGSSDVCYQLV